MRRKREGEQSARLYRQGDVLLVEVTDAPVVGEWATQERGDRLVLAHGEATGHAHVIRSQRADLAKRRRSASRVQPRELHLLVYGDEPVALEHEEHDALLIPPGAYRVVRQREYVPGPAPERRVAD